jgi:hypothetical protein
MKSAECFQHAAKCEQMALDAQSEQSRKTMAEAARHWRFLGREAAAEEEAAIPKPGEATGHD